LRDHQDAALKREREREISEAAKVAAAQQAASARDAVLERASVRARPTGMPPPPAAALSSPISPLPRPNPGSARLVCVWVMIGVCCSLGAHQPTALPRAR
jgi:hypothetical protein